MGRKIYYTTLFVRLLTMVIFFMVNSALFAQSTDTMQLAPVEVISGKEQGKLNRQIMDSTLLGRSGYAGIENVLQKYSPILIKSYGSGSSAMASYQGFSPSQVPVIWNGVPARAGMTGVTDLSLFSLNARQSLSWGDMTTGQGLTGALSMEQKWTNDSVLLNTTLSAGGYGYLQGNVFYQQLFSKAGIQAYGSGSRAINDYKYNNYTVIPEQEERQNYAAYQKMVVGQSWKVTSKNLRHILTGITEGYYNNRQIPPTLLSPVNKAVQSDAGLRTLASWKYSGKNWTNELRSAWMFSKLDYDDLSLDQNSRNKGNLWWLRERFTVGFNNVWKLETGTEAGIDRIESNNYASGVNEWQLLPYLQVSANPVYWLTAIVQVKGVFIQRYQPSYTILGGLEGRVIEQKPICYFLQLKKNVRFPSLNDRFWQPGGNPDVREENAVTIEAGFRLDDLPIRSRWQFSAYLKGAYTKANDLIFWFPGNKVYWTPTNILQVSSGSFESNFRFNYRKDNLLLSAGIIGQASKITSREAIANNDNSVGKQLIYVPVGSLKGFSLISWKEVSFMADMQYYSRRFITSDNVSYLPGYAILNLQAGYNKTIKNKHGLEVLLSVENVTNKQYEEIAYRPMPGTHFSVTLIYQF